MHDLPGIVSTTRIDDHRQRAREILHQVDDLRALDADRGLDLVARDHRPGIRREHPARCTPKSASLRSISRDVNSSVSALTVSCAAGASSSSASGGSGESGMSVNSGRCFSLTTRSDFGDGGGRRHDDDRLALLVLLAHRSHDVLALGRACSPMRRSLALLAPRAEPRRRSASTPRADALHQLQPRHAEEEREADGEQREQQQRRAVEAESRAQRRGRAMSPIAPPGAPRQRQRQAATGAAPRARRYASSTSAKPMHAEQQRMVGLELGVRRCGDSRRRRARRRATTHHHADAPNRYSSRSASHAPTTPPRLPIGAPVPENDQPGSVRV